MSNHTPKSDASSLMNSFRLVIISENFRLRNRWPMDCRIARAINGKSTETRFDSWRSSDRVSSVMCGKACGTTRRRSPSRHWSRAQWIQRTSWPKHKSWRSCDTASWFSCMPCVRLRSRSTSLQSWWSMDRFWNSFKVSLSVMRTVLDKLWLQIFF